MVTLGFDLQFALLALYLINPSIHEGWLEGSAMWEVRMIGLLDWPSQFYGRKNRRLGVEQCTSWDICRGWHCTASAQCTVGRGFTNKIYKIWRRRKKIHVQIWQTNFIRNSSKAREKKKKKNDGVKPKKSCITLYPRPPLPPSIKITVACHDRQWQAGAIVFLDFLMFCTYKVQQNTLKVWLQHYVIWIYMV